jgi:hypothetical protein
MYLCVTNAPPSEAALQMQLMELVNSDFVPQFDLTLHCIVHLNYAQSHRGVPTESELRSYP